MEERIYEMPMYFKDFKCKADKCRNTCCQKWNIRIKKDEFDRLKNVECSEKLKSCINEAFPEFIKVNDSPLNETLLKFNKNGYCPIQENGLCMLHKELGESFLPNVCKTYPRIIRSVNNKYSACCATSCEAVIESLYNYNNYYLVKEKLNIEPNIKKETKNSFMDVFDVIIKTLNNKNNTLVNNIEEICLMFEKDKYIVEKNTELYPLNVGLYLLNRFFGSSNYEPAIITQKILNRYKTNFEQYKIDCEIFQNNNKNWNVFFSNLILNSLYVNEFPYVDRKIGEVDACKGLCTIYGLLKIISVGCTSIYNNDEKILTMMISSLFKIIEHTRFFYDVVLVCNCSALLLKI